MHLDEDMLESWKVNYATLRNSDVIDHDEEQQACDTFINSIPTPKPKQKRQPKSTKNSQQSDNNNEPANKRSKRRLDFESTLNNASDEPRKTKKRNTQSQSQQASQDRISTESMPSTSGSQRPKRLTSKPKIFTEYAEGNSLDYLTNDEEFEAFIASTQVS